MAIEGKPSEAGPRALAPTPLYMIASEKWKIQTEMEQLFTASLSYPHDATNYLNEGGFPLAHASAGTMSSLVHHWFPDWQKKSQKSNSGRLAPTCL